MYEESISDPDVFWKEHGNRIDWIKPYTKVKDDSYSSDDIHVRWFYDGTLNASANCIDRHLKTRGDELQLFGNLMIQMLIYTLPTMNCMTTFANLRMD